MNKSATNIGQRIQIMGSSNAGKSTLGKQLGNMLQLPFIDLDALNWEPNWYGLSTNEPDRFERRIQHATKGDSWIVAGAYTRFTQRLLWSRVQTIVWLDMPLPLLVYRMVKRTWRRWRTKELIWGTNYERFWPQLAIWRKEESLLWWIISTYKQRRYQMYQFMQDTRWRHIHFIHIQGPRNLAAWCTKLEQDMQRYKSEQLNVE